jgi:hypothetical protein
LKSTTNVIPIYGSKVEVNPRDAKSDNDGSGIVEVIPRRPSPPPIATLELAASENYPTRIVVLKSLDFLETVYEQLLSVRSEGLSSIEARLGALYFNLVEVFFDFQMERISRREMRVKESMIYFRINEHHVAVKRLRKDLEDTMEMARDVANMRSMVAIDSDE